MTGEEDRAIGRLEGRLEALQQQVNTEAGAVRSMQGDIAEIKEILARQSGRGTLAHAIGQGVLTIVAAVVGGGAVHWFGR